MTAISGTREASDALRATCSAASMVAEARSLSASPTASTSFSPSRSPAATRNSSRRRIARIASTAATGFCWRPAAACISTSRSARERGRELLVVGQHLHRLRSPGQQRHRVPAGGEDPGQPLRHRPLVPQCPQIPRGVAQRLRHLTEGQQAGVRVRAGGEPAQHGRQQLALDLRLTGSRPGTGRRCAGGPPWGRRSRAPATGPARRRWSAAARRTWIRATAPSSGE